MILQLLNDKINSTMLNFRIINMNEKILDFQKSIELQESEKLISAFQNERDYQSEYIDLVKRELEKRGYVLNELVAFDEYQGTIEKVADEELMDIYVNPSGQV